MVFVNVIHRRTAAAQQGLEVLEARLIQWTLIFSSVLCVCVQSVIQTTFSQVLNLPVNDLYLCTNTSCFRQAVNVFIEYHQCQEQHVTEVMPLHQ